MPRLTPIINAAISNLVYFSLIGGMSSRISGGLSMLPSGLNGGRLPISVLPSGLTGGRLASCISPLGAGGMLSKLGTSPCAKGGLGGRISVRISSRCGGGPSKLGG